MTRPTEIVIDAVGPRSNDFLVAGYQPVYVRRFVTVRHRGRAILSRLKTRRLWQRHASVLSVLHDRRPRQRGRSPATWLCPAILSGDRGDHVTQFLGLHEDR